MDWLEGMRNAIDYMEDNLLTDIDNDEVARRAYSSTYHFLRMFSMLTGFTVGEYIRNRRLTLAAQDLSMHKMKVTEVAFKYGYDTSESFTKAFQRLHGVTPSAARKLGVQLKSFHRLSIQVTMKGDKEMNYKIMKQEAFEVIGKSIEITGETAFDLVPKFWLELGKQGFFEKLCKSAGFKNTIVPTTAVTYDFQQDGSRRYAIAYDLQTGTKTDGYEVISIPDAEWVIVEEKCPSPEETSDTVQEMWTRVFSEWFPSSGYEVAEGPQLERYDDKKLEIWIPVVKKEL